MNLVRLELAKGLARHLRAGHPWVFRKALERPPKLPAGSVVDVTENGKFVARGYYDPHSPIAVRVLTRDASESVDARFFKERVRRAMEMRRSLIDLADTDSFRLVHGEGDGLPGVVIDLYAGFAVLKLYSAGLTPSRSLIVEAVKSVVPRLKGIIGRDEIGRDDSEIDSGAGNGKPLWGEKAPEKILITERGSRFWVDPYRGQKTGFFLDQRENRSLIRRLSRGRRVLNCFSYTGGFSVNAALGGAQSVVSVDSDSDAIALARENFACNGLAVPHDLLVGDVFEVLAQMKSDRRTFDLLILDPPAFAKSQRTVDAGLAGYASLNRQALALLRSGGLLATSSCSARVSADAFRETLKEAAFKAGGELALVEERYQPPDHPIRLQFPEGRYLKFFVLQVI